MAEPGEKQPLVRTDDGTLAPVPIVEDITHGRRQRRAHRAWSGESHHAPQAGSAGFNPVSSPVGAGSPRE